ncbi:helix-turn-helix domain-containing protein [Sphingomonas parva]|uniref:Helix-turn-helix domain-containing protein n=1 Tax=Sphingomonas parva TaxID=2555898 RepID=A0A4Y8ZLK2_9SPHN|nr:helix-turn-helix domain-containing protein [Sphingomonas parva]TFI56883.1 helix-turn-helix domain-containing protein [Sphingomonas parva]
MAEVLGNRLYEFRFERELTQAALAQLVGVSRKTINTVENGVFVPSTLLALKLARALDCRVEDIFSLEEEDDDHDL